MTAKRIAILGGGMTGLVAARELARRGHAVDVYEGSDAVGGLAKTYKDPDGFTYDNGPRFIFSTLAENLGISHLCEPVPYYEDIYVDGRTYRFPFGLIKNPKYFTSAGLATLTRSFKRRPRNLREFLQTYYGRIFSNEVLRPLIEKWAGVPAQEVSIDFASRLLPTNIGYIIHSVVKKLRRGVTEDYYKKGRFIVYPRGSNRVIFDTLASTTGVNIHLERPVHEVLTEGPRVVALRSHQEKITADYFISTIPIHHLEGLIDQRPAELGWSKLHYRGIMILFLKIARPHLLQHLWTWFPENRFPFYRISEFKNARADLAPADKTLVSIEFAVEREEILWESSADELFRRILPDLDRLYELKTSEVIGVELKRSPYAYPVLQVATEEIQRAIQHTTPFENLFVAGRTGSFQYRMLEGCYESAVECVKVLEAAPSGRSVGSRTVERDSFGRPLIVPE